jgi:hypothetical protein
MSIFSRQEQIVEYGYLEGYGQIPRCFQEFAARDFSAFELTLRLGQMLERKRIQKQKRKLARA